mmetsp:Transcript_35282/g.77284  ORF Transcript_35282/g.77284 Transcript_35282/m.77284 type:complete len:168 (+) Transcript_35282:83-586(+)|eukprot:CAMPEP_0178482242 /NCGR_PEP_ID=MMETSP0696-20121128/6625_1 /TAXON_ID=265572 /ORGANISM="Extubocellulus spinifer, Strain CCMP396" /LENGTH=167 /DNA_ID=CAMNT_0020109737 /DNA_START=67 /DNA_END=570 /DNA_ORIENTATION=+
MPKVTRNRQPFCCPVRGCRKSFATPQLRTNHTSTAHRRFHEAKQARREAELTSMRRPYGCPFPHCFRRFKDRNGWCQHLRKKHKISATEISASPLTEANPNPTPGADPPLLLDGATISAEQDRPAAGSAVVSEDALDQGRNESQNDGETAERAAEDRHCLVQECTIS